MRLIIQLQMPTGPRASMPEGDTDAPLGVLGPANPRELDKTEDVGLEAALVLADLLLRVVRRRSRADVDRRPVRALSRVARQRVKEAGKRREDAPSARERRRTTFRRPRRRSSRARRSHRSTAGWAVRSIQRARLSQLELRRAVTREASRERTSKKSSPPTSPSLGVSVSLPLGKR